MRGGLKMNLNTFHSSREYSKGIDLLEVYKDQNEENDDSHNLMKYQK